MDEILGTFTITQLNLMTIPVGAAGTLEDEVREQRNDLLRDLKKKTADAKLGPPTRQGILRFLEARERERRQGPARQTGPKQTGPKQTGPKQTGPKQTGPKQTGPKQTGPKQTGPKQEPELESRETIVKSFQFGKSWHDEGKYRRLPAWFNELVDGSFYVLGGFAEGTCFYHAAVKAINPNVVNFTEKERRKAGVNFRRLLRDHVRKLGEDYYLKNFRDIAFDNKGKHLTTLKMFLDKMLRPSEWVDQPEIIYFLSFIDYNLLIIDRNLGQVMCITQFFDPSRETIILQRISDIHYELVIKRVALNRIVVRFTTAEIMGLLVKFHEDCGGKFPTLLIP